MLLKIIILAIIALILTLLSVYYNKLFNKPKQLIETTGTIITKAIDQNYNLYDIKFNVDDKEIICKSPHYIKFSNKDNVNDEVKIGYYKTKQGEYKIKILNDEFEEFNIDKTIKSICLIIAIALWVIVFGLIFVYFTKVN